mmetsp:Transcript_43973/g.116234  ORF Transcript_43973/g.116234 Transcript_43973/m.116234 type:complete len:257 (+) Transcript_43973:820-1590(+)
MRIVSSRCLLVAQSCLVSGSEMNRVHLSDPNIEDTPCITSSTSGDMLLLGLPNKCVSKSRADATLPPVWVSTFWRPGPIILPRHATAWASAFVKAPRVWRLLVNKATPTLPVSPRSGTHNKDFGGRSPRKLDGQSFFSFRNPGASLTTRGTPALYTAPTTPAPAHVPIAGACAANKPTTQRRCNTPTSSTTYKAPVLASTKSTASRNQAGTRSSRYWVPTARLINTWFVAAAAIVVHWRASSSRAWSPKISASLAW